MKSENKIGLQKDKNEVEIKIILVFKYIIMAIIVGIVVGNNRYNFWKRIDRNI